MGNRSNQAKNGVASLISSIITPWALGGLMLGLFLGLFVGGILGISLMTSRLQPRLVAAEQKLVTAKEQVFSAVLGMNVDCREGFTQCEAVLTICKEDKDALLDQLEILDAETPHEIDRRQ